MMINHSALALAALSSVSLYVHIPFCTSRCRYCSFYFETGWSPRIMTQLLDTMLRQSHELRQALFPGRQANVHTVYIGGGTPSVVPPAMLDNFLMQFCAVWELTAQPPIEFAFEANPESLSQELLAVLARHGVSRISMGVQSLSEQALQLLGRRAGNAEVTKAATLVAAARRDGSWRGSVNMDLITGIPGQTPQSIVHDLEFMIGAGADHVSVYSLTVEPDTALEQLFELGLAQPVPAEQHESLWESAEALLASRGFVNYEVSNFARPGFESRHNLAYWSLHPYAGIGPGAVGTLAIRGNTGLIPVRLTNPKLFEYSRPSQHESWYEVEYPSPGEFFTDHLLTGLRTNQGVSRAKLVKIFGLQAHNVLDLLVSYWTAKAVLAENKPNNSESICFSMQGRLILDPLLTDSLAELESRMPDWQDRLVCNWPTDVVE